MYVVFDEACNKYNLKKMPNKTLLLALILLLTILKFIEARPINIKGTEVTERRNFGYMVSVRYNDEHICGGSIIHKDFILTASHCVLYSSTVNQLKTNNLKVVSGDLNLKKPNEHTAISEISKIIPHPNYNPQTTENDIALIKLKESLQLNDFVKVIEFARETPVNGSTCIVSGWGPLKEGNDEKSDVLKYLDLPIIDKDKCNDAYEGGIKNGMLCAGFMEGGADACQYYSGGPLVCNDKLSGIVSWGKGCARAGYPGVYTDVANYVKFIEEVIKDEEINDEKMAHGNIDGRNTSNENNSAMFYARYISIVPMLLITINLLC